MTSLLGTWEIRRRQLELELDTWVKFRSLSQANVLSLACDHFISISVLPVRETSHIIERGEKAWQKFVGFTSILSVSHVFLILNVRKRMGFGMKPECAFGWSTWPPLRWVEKEVVRPTLWGYEVTFVDIIGTSAQPTVRHALNVSFPSVTSLQDECLLR